MGLMRKYEWTFDNFPVSLGDLKPKAREKAVEIANKLIKTGKYDEQQAVKEAVKQAEEWFYESEG